MKKKLFILLFTIGFQMHAQEFGIRLGSFENNNIAIDGIVNFDDKTRLHGDITFGNGIGANLLYDFMVDKIDVAGVDFQYYFGTGLTTFIGKPFVLGVNAEAGLEYLFKEIPITIGLDWRPQLNIISKTSLKIDYFGLNIRYRINEL